MKKKILITTGGSGGHVIPASVLNDHLQYEFNVVISTDLRGKKYLTNDNLIIIDTPKLNNFLLLPFKILYILLLSIKSFFILRKKKIDIIISTGGYMSFPICIAAKILSIKIYLVEPNLVLGRANRFFLYFCTKIFCYSEKLKNFPNNYRNKIVTIKPLIRKKFQEKFDNTKKNLDQFKLMIIGGSQGAKIFDKEINEAIIDLSKKYSLKVTHQTSEKNIEYLIRYYSKHNIKNKIFSFDSNFQELIKQSDLCITRAGASTLAELIAVKTPFIAVPLLESKDNHQYENANFYKELGCCWILNQKDFNKRYLMKFLSNIFINKDDYLEKKSNIENLNYQNSWNEVNQKILKNLK